MIDGLHTERLLLRRWTDADLEPFAAMNADPMVMRHFPNVLDREASDALVRQFDQHFDEHGFGLWVLELKDGGSSPSAFLGFVGLWRTTFDAHFTPCVEVAWRLAGSAWGKGYAVEAAREACRVGFEQIGLREIVAHTVPDNFRSRRVMERLGMTHNASDDFDHPRLPEGHPLRHHVLYRLAGPRNADLENVA